jgi:hypothetical protein
MLNSVNAGACRRTANHCPSTKPANRAETNAFAETLESIAKEDVSASEEIERIDKAKWTTLLGSDYFTEEELMYLNMLRGEMSAERGSVVGSEEFYSLAYDLKKNGFTAEDFKVMVKVPYDYKINSEDFDERMRVAGEHERWRRALPPVYIVDFENLAMAGDEDEYEQWRKSEPKQPENSTGINFISNSWLYNGEVYASFKEAFEAYSKDRFEQKQKWYNEELAAFDAYPVRRQSRLLFENLFDNLISKDSESREALLARLKDLRNVA